MRGIREAERRIIDVLVYAENKLLVIQISNPVSGLPRIGADGLPVSTKSGDGVHGYGLKSVRHAVQKYRRLFDREGGGRVLPPAHPAAGKKVNGGVF